MSDSTKTTRPAYYDRVDRLITDPEVIEARWVQDQIFKLMGELNGVDIPVADVAAAAGKTAAEVVAIIRERDGWLWGLVENDGPMETWKVFLDGE